VNKKYEAKCLTKVFRDRGWNFGRLNILIAENDSSCGINPRPHTGRPHTARITVNINKFKYLTNFTEGVVHRLRLDPLS